MNIILSTLNAKYIHSSLALRYLRAGLKVPANIQIKEYTINNHLPDILGNIFDASPDILCFACYIWNIEQTLKLISLVKKVLPECKIIVGGPEVSYNAEEVLMQNKDIDYAIMGEGEEVLNKTIDSIINNGCAINIPGLVWRVNNNVVSLGGPQIVADLNAIPFPYQNDDLLNLKNKIIYYESSRGCPFNCQYCLSGTTKGVRFFDVARVLQELDYFINHKVKQVKFVDRTYNVNKNHFLPIMKHLATTECTTNFHFEITADLLDEEVLEFLKSVPKGRFQFEIGVQSTNPLTLEHVGRKNDWRRLREVVMALKENQNIHLHLDLIAGLPYEDMQSFANSFNDVFLLKPDVLQLGFLKLLHGSPLKEKMHDYGYVAMDMPPYEVLANNVISYKEIRKLKILEEVFESIYNSNRFKTTVKWFISISSSAFTFFNKLADYWHYRGLHLMSHSPQMIAQYLADFCREKYPKQMHICTEMLKYDSLIDKAQPASDNLRQEKNAFFKNEAKVKQYVPNYKFTNWRDINNKYRLVQFSHDIPGFLLTGQLKEKQTILLFVLDKNEIQIIDVSKDELFNEI